MTLTSAATPVPLAPEHADGLQAFFDSLPDEDVTVVKEDVRDRDAVRASAEPSDGRARRWVALADDEVVGYASLLPGVGLSSHVGELRLVVSRTRRRQGIGRTLARTVLGTALRDGLSKIYVEVPADEQATADVFGRLGFEGEAILRDHVRDRAGALHDVLVLAHFAEENSSVIAGLGLTSS